MVESTALEMRRTGNCTGGSNPSLSANTQMARTGHLSIRKPGGDEPLFDIASDLGRRAK